MIRIIQKNQSKPYKLFNIFYEEACKKSQKGINVISISSYNIKENEVNSRYVNLKYIDDDKWTFFTNYNSNKAKDFKSHDQISALIYWDKINLQIRMKARIELSSNAFSDLHFQNRSSEKNALAISSDQSRQIESYEAIIKKYNSQLIKPNNNIRPSYWGGYSFTPYEIEFWEGNEFRLNKRNLYKKDMNKWNHYILEP
jgi:pyridoxamine 5'-phosphate oxidase